MALYELRQYKVRDGKMSAWLELMEGEIIPYVVSNGLVFSESAPKMIPRYMFGFAVSKTRPTASGFMRKSMKASTGNPTFRRGLANFSSVKRPSFTGLFRHAYYRCSSFTSQVVCTTRSARREGRRPVGARRLTRPAWAG